MKQIMKMAVLGLAVLLSMPVSAQNRLHPYGYDYMRNFSRLNYICWGYRVEPSFDANYEIKCIRNSEDRKFYVTMFNDMQKKQEIDEEQAYQIRTLFDVAVFSSTYLPESVEYALWSLKTGDARIVEDGLDGENYYFYNNRYGAYCWSPYNGNNAELVKIGEALVNAFKDGDFSDVKFLSEDIVSLTKAYIEQLQEQYREYFTLRMEKKPQGWWSEEY